MFYRFIKCIIIFYNKILDFIEKYIYLSEIWKTKIWSLLQKWSGPIGGDLYRVHTSNNTRRGGGRRRAGEARWRAGRPRVWGPALLGTSRLLTWPFAGACQLLAAWPLRPSVAAVCRPVSVNGRPAGPVSVVGQSLWSSWCCVTFCGFDPWRLQQLNLVFWRLRYVRINFIWHIHVTGDWN